MIGRLSALVLLLALAACSPPTPSSVTPQPSPASPSPVAEASLHPSPDTSPGQARWREQTVLPADRHIFALAASQSRLVVGAETTWVGLGAGRWMPAEAVDRTNRLGITTWEGALVSWAQGGEVQVSRDGLTWSNAVSGPGDSNLATVVSFEKQLLLLGEGVRSSVGAWRSVDGSTWIPIEGAPLGMMAAASQPGRGLVAVGSSGSSAAAWSTADARTWETLAGPHPAGAGTSALYGVAADADRVVAIGHVDGEAAVWSSDDLVTWTQSPNMWGEDAYLSSIDFVRGTFVIAGRRGHRPVVWLSVDGQVWTTFDLPLASGAVGEAVETTIDKDKLVVFGYSTQDAGNGGSFRTGYLVWTLDPPD